MDECMLSFSTSARPTSDEYAYGDSFRTMKIISEWIKFVDKTFSKWRKIHAAKGKI